MPRSRNFVRTPRKRKVWAESHSSYVITANTPFVAANLITGYEGDLGVTYLQGVTVMGVAGQIWLAENGAASTAAYCRVHLGMVWVPQAIAAATAGDSQIPEPGQQGVREDRWYQEATLHGVEASGSIVSIQPLGPAGLSRPIWDVSTRNMQRQPTVNHQFCLVGTTTGQEEASTIALYWNLRILLALP